MMTWYFDGQWFPPRVLHGSRPLSLATLQAYQLQQAVSRSNAPLHSPSYVHGMTTYAYGPIGRTGRVITRIKD